MKRFISILLSVVFLISLSVPSFAAKGVSFTAYDSEVFAGDEFTLDIFISDNSLLKSATLLIYYDDSSLQFLDFNVGSIVAEGAVAFKNVNKGAEGSYIQVDYKDISASLSSAGKFCSVTFAANDDAIGKTDIKLSVKGGKVLTSAGTVSPTYKNAKINIINNIVPSAISTTENTVTSPSVSEPNEAEATSSQTTTEKVTGVTEPITTAEAKPEKQEKDNKVQIIIAAVVIMAVFILIVCFDSKGTVGGTRKGKKRKKRKSKR